MMPLHVHITNSITKAPALEAKYILNKNNQLLNLNFENNNLNLPPKIPRTVRIAAALVVATAIGVNVTEIPFTVISTSLKE